MSSTSFTDQTSRKSSSSLDILARSAEYAQTVSNSHHAPIDAASPPVRPRKPASSGRPAVTVRPSAKKPDGIRRRITRACDRCNSLRTKCDGADPCSTCTESSSSCEYKRTARKRGKAPAKEKRNAVVHLDPLPNVGDDSVMPDAPSPNPYDDAQVAYLYPSANRNSVDQPQRLPKATAPVVPSPPQPGLGNNDGFGFGEFNTVDTYAPHLQSQHLALLRQYDQYAPPFPGTNSQIGSHAAPHPTSQTTQHETRSQNPPTTSPGVASLAPWLSTPDPAHSPGRFSLPSIPSPGNAGFGSRSQSDSSRFADVKYPVLRPVLAYTSPIIPASLACELLELYFTSSTSAFQHPLSPYVIAYVFRKNSFLGQQNVRQCSPALLASMLWISAQTSDAQFLTASLAARGRACQKLLELTIMLLKPLVHQSNSGDDPSVTVINGVALGGFGVNVNLPLPGGRHASDIGQYHPQFFGGEIDDIATYMHLATVISASEYKAASMRWWNVVYSLLREHRFSKELPRLRGDYAADRIIDSASTTPSISEEAREERRRIWWLAYTVDKHLALCYNIPLALRDSDCANLLRPVTEAHWQAGESYTPPAPDEMRPRGISLELTDYGIFGFFTPLMTLLGEVIDLQQARLRMSTHFHSASHILDPVAMQARKHINVYLDSIAAFRTRLLPRDFQDGMPDNRKPPGGFTEEQVQTIIVTAYASYVARALMVLVAGRWDPIQLLDDDDMWIGSPEFTAATEHATVAAEALAPILDFDPDLSFMPWFFGIYLLQGSFVLLLFPDRLGAGAGARYIGACERSVRACEACVVTLNTEYQRNFRKVMRSALSQVRGRVPADCAEQQVRRREVLGLYRWTADGAGLAL